MNVHESVVHVLWECPVYEKYTFMGELDKLLGGGGGGGGSFEEFITLDNFNRTGFILGVRIGTGMISKPY